MDGRTKSRNSIGAAGETLAAEYLVSLGWRILARNWRCAVGELDIIAADTAGAVVFCEVKSRRSKAFGSPLEAITTAKMQKLRELAMCWLREQPSYTAHFRFDGIGVFFLPGSTPEITHKQGIGS
ncbi:MAG: YraN family protein [Propionibacteriaceae bacterium]|nr:YraN family protein [Propionibacteriaceae bacterium]